MHTEYADIVTFTEDAAGNSTSSGTIANVAFSGQGTRSDSCGSGSAQLIFGEVIIPASLRFMVNDGCDVITAVITSPVGGVLIPVTNTLERVMSSPSGAFLEQAGAVLD